MERCLPGVRRASATLGHLRIDGIRPAARRSRSRETSSRCAPGPLYSDRANFVALVGKLSDFGATRRIKALMAGATDLPVHSINAPTLVAGIDFSDHLNYWRLGYPAFMVTDTAFMRNTNYHAASDTHDTLDHVRMAKVVQAVYAVAQAY